MSFQTVASPSSGIAAASRPVPPLDPLGRVLFIESDPDLSYLVRTALAADPDIDIYCAGEEAARDAIRKDMPDLLMLDLGKDGIAATRLLRELRASPTFMHLPVILLHEYPPPVGAAAALDFSIGSIRKPLDVVRLPRQLREFWENRPK
jgi:DNA-binding response OmpR family regulator